MNESMGILSNIPLFSYLSPTELGEAQKLFNEETFNKGDTICRMGDVGDKFYIVLSGELEVRAGSDAAQIVAYLNPGDFFGELALVLGAPRSATITVSQRSRLLSLTKEAFDRYLLQNTKVLEYFSRIMCQRLASAARGDNPEKKTTVISVVSQKGLKGKTLVATALTELIGAMTGKRVLLIRTGWNRRTTRRPDSHEKKMLENLLKVPQERLWQALRLHEDDSTFQVSIDARTKALGIWLDPNQGRALYGERFSALIERLTDDFEYFIFDLGSEPQALMDSVGDFSDMLVKIVDRTTSENGHQAESPRASFKTYTILNLFNRSTMPIPINRCEPFVLPNGGTLKNDDAQKILSSSLAVPLNRLSRKILGRTIGLALGGGAAFGLAHLGVIKVLESNNIPIDLIAGCSMGSMVACGYAAGVSTDRLIEMANTLGAVSKVIRVVDPTLTRPGMLGGDRIKTVFGPFLGARQTFKDLILPCRVIATDILTGERVEIGTGRLDKAFRASSSVPVVLAPVKEGERVLVDGGVCDPVPADTVIDMGADICVAINVVPPPKRGVEMILSRLFRQFNPLTYLGTNGDMPNMFDITMHAMQILQYELGNFKAISADVRINPDVSDFTWVDFARAPEIIAKGVEATERALPAIKRAIADRMK